MLYYICINKIHTDVGKYNDLYVEIKCNNKIKKTTTIWNKEYPIWNEEFIFTINNNIKSF